MHFKANFIFKTGLHFQACEPWFAKAYVSDQQWKTVTLSNQILHLGFNFCINIENEPFMRKPIYAIYEQQRRRSACASMQSDQRLCCSLPR